MLQVIQYFMMTTVTATWRVGEAHGNVPHPVFLFLLRAEWGESCP